MSKKEVLELLRELLRDAYISETDPDDMSGCNTRYYIDQEQLLKNIEHELEQCPTVQSDSEIENDRRLEGRE